MPAEDIHFILDKQEMKKSKLKRCLLCGRDKENLFPQNLKVNQKTFDKLSATADEFSCLKVLSQQKHIPVIDAVIDDLNLKLINGIGYQVNLKMCQECLHRIAWRHKHKRNVFITA